MNIHEQLLAAGEPFAAGLYENTERGLFYRKALGLRRYYESGPLYPYIGGRLYPAGKLNRQAAVSPWYSESMTIDAKRIDAAVPGSTKMIRDEFYRWHSTVPPEHAVGGNMYTHSMPHYKRVAAEGLDSYVPRIEKIEDDDIREGLLHLIEGLREYSRRIVEYLRSQNANAELIEALLQVPFKPARNIYEALVCHNFVFYLDTCDNAGCLASDLLPYYKGEDITELIREFYRNIEVNDGYSLSLGVDYSPLTVQCLEAVKGMRRPMVELFIDDNCPDEVWNTALDAIRTNGGQPAFYNHDKIINGLSQRFPEIREGDLERYCGGGCTETMFEGLCCVGSLEAGINLPLILTESIKKHLRSAADFEDFYSKFIDDTREVCDMVTSEINSSQKSRAELRPLPMRTLLTDDCIDKGMDFFSGGARYSWSIINFAGIINVIDSMLVIEDYIYQTKQLSADELISLLDNNDEEFLKKASNHPSRHGIDDPRTSALANRFSRDVYSLLDGKIPYIGLGFIPASIQFRTAASSGKYVPATPDGRHAGDPLCESLGAVSGKDTKGPTAMLSSVTALDVSKALGIPVTNLTIRPDFSNDVLRTLIKSYFDMGGMYLQITCTSKQMLEEAYADPDKHKNLVIRVGGYSEYFHRLDDDLKRLVMSRTIH